MKIQIIEDNPGDVRLVREILKQTGQDFDITVAETLKSGLNSLLSEYADVVLLDMNLPDSRGIETLTTLQAQFSHTPVVIMTSLDDEELGVQAAGIGAQDYLVKGKVDGEVLWRVLKYAIERKKFDEKILREKEQWEATFNSVPDLIAILDKGYRVIRVNKAMADRLGVQPEQCKGLHCYEAVHGLSHPPDFCPHTKTCQDGKEHVCDVHEPRLGGDFLVSTTPTRDNNGVTTGSIHVARDITERKQAESIKDEFVGMVSHEIKTPLTVIIGALAVAMDSEISQEQRDDLINDAFKSAKSLANITENLLELSRYQSKRLNLLEEQVDIMEIAQEVIKKLRDRSDIHKLSIDIPVDIPSAKIDPFRIERVLHNLVENAIKYSPKGGDVKIIVRERDSQLIVQVKDQGLGISLQDQKRLFKHFERIDAYEKYSISGLGLGLKVCQILVEAHGGKIWLESEVDKGSAFFFSIPLS